MARIIQPFYSVNSLLITHSTSNTLIYAVMPSCTKNEIKEFLQPTADSLEILNFFQCMFMLPAGLTVAYRGALSFKQIVCNQLSGKSFCLSVSLYCEWPSLARIIQPFYSVNSLLITHSTSNTLIYAVMPSCTKNEIKKFLQVAL